MYLHQLHYLKLVIEQGTFAGAAKVASVSQPAITKAMASLEGSLQVELFERSGRRKIPTATAVRIALQGELLDSGIASAKAVGDVRLRSAQTGKQSVHIGISYGAAMMYGPRIAQVWHADGDTGPVRLVGGDSALLLNGLNCGELDVVIAPRPRASTFRHLQEVELFSSTPAVYARRNHPLASADSLSQLGDIGWVVVGRKGSPGLMVEETFRVRRLKAPRILVECSDYATLLHIVAQSDMMGIVPNEAIVKVLQASKVQRLQIQEGLARYSICLYRPNGPGVSQREKVDALVDTLLRDAQAIARKSTAPKPAGGGR